MSYLYWVFPKNLKISKKNHHWNLFLALIFEKYHFSKGHNIVNFNSILIRFDINNKHWMLQLVFRGNNIFETAPLVGRYKRFFLRNSYFAFNELVIYICSIIEKKCWSSTACFKYFFTKKKMKHQQCKPQIHIWKGHSCLFVSNFRFSMYFTH